jgi:hypothetical protein
MTDQALRAALLKLHAHSPLPASRFTTVQRSALDRFARQTGAVQCQRQGRGDVYCISDPMVFDAHARALSPQVETAVDTALPTRAQHLAYARDSKAGRHQHDWYYPLLKAVGDAVTWHNGEGATLPLSALTRDFGAATLGLECDDGWHTERPLWLIENQALFDRTDWFPEEASATLLYYGGQIDGRLLAWLGRRRRASRVVLFADYDGVGLSRYVRLHQVLGDACEFWLMPHWEQKLARYGSAQVWRKTQHLFAGAAALIPTPVRALAEQMRRQGLALEQEAVWLPVTG